MKIERRDNQRRSTNAKRAWLATVATCGVIAGATYCQAELRSNPFVDAADQASTVQPASHQEANASSLKIGAPAIATKDPGRVQSNPNVMSVQPFAVTKEKATATKSRPKRLPIVATTETKNVKERPVGEAVSTSSLSKPDDAETKPKRPAKLPPVRPQTPDAQQDSPAQPTLQPPVVNPLGAKPSPTATSQADETVERPAMAIDELSQPVRIAGRPFGATSQERADETVASSQFSPQVSMRSPRPQATSKPQRPSTWLPSSTSSSSQQAALRMLQQAMHEYSRRAWASAEASAWESLRHTAEGIDIADRAATGGRNRAKSNASTDLSLAREAIRESRDFAGKYGQLDTTAVERIVMSHTTSVLKEQSLRDVPATDATDRYLDDARKRLSRLAKIRPEAAQALDLLAAIHLGRGNESQLPGPTALCLRRAALQGQPNNASLAARLGMHLASLGLDQEAEWALRHSMSINPTQEVQESLSLVTRRAGERAEAIRVATRMRSRLPSGYDHQRGSVPAVVQLTPREFASASRPVVAPGQQAVPTAPVAPQMQRQPVQRPAVNFRPASTQGYVRPQPPATPKPVAEPRVVAEPKAKVQPPAKPRGNAKLSLPSLKMPAFGQQPKKAASQPRLASPVANVPKPIATQVSKPQLKAPTTPPKINANQIAKPVQVAPMPAVDLQYESVLGTPADFTVSKPKSTVRRMLDSVKIWK